MAAFAVPPRQRATPQGRHAGPRRCADTSWEGLRVLDGIAGIGGPAYKRSHALRRPHAVCFLDSLVTTLPDLLYASHGWVTAQRFVQEHGLAPQVVQGWVTAGLIQPQAETRRYFDRQRLAELAAAQLTAGTAAFDGDMDISVLNLGMPNSSTAIPLPVTFTWTPRSTSPAESYRLALWDPDDYNIRYDTDNLGHAGSFTLWGLPSGFTTGHRYRWVVYAYDGSGGYGGSYYSNSVTFSSATANTIYATDSSSNQDRVSRSGDKELPADVIHPPTKR